MKSVLMRLCAGLLAVSLAGAAEKTQLLVYTALETDQLKVYKEAFEKAHPDIVLKWVRDSTGIVAARLLAEKANPQERLRLGGQEPRPHPGRVDPALRHQGRAQVARRGRQAWT